MAKSDTNQTKKKAAANLTAVFLLMIFIILI